MKLSKAVEIEKLNTTVQNAPALTNTLYHQVFENASVGVALVGEDKKPIMCNKYLCKLLGYTTEELQQMAFTEFTHPEDAAIDLEQFEKLVRGEIRDYSIEKRYIKKNGDIIWGGLSVSMVDEKLALGIIKNITKEVNLRRKLQKSEASLKEAQEVAVIGNFDFDIVNNILKWSDQMYQIFGLSKEEFGASYEAFMSTIHPDDRKMVDDDVKEAIEERRMHDVTHRIIKPNGDVRIVRERAKIYYANNEATRIAGTTQDVTEERILQIELEENLACQNVLSEIALKINRKETFENKINSVLKTLGETTNVSRAYIFENFNNNKKCKNTYEWCAKGVRPQINNLQNVNYAQEVPSFKKYLEKNEKIYSEDVSEMPEDLRDILEPQDIKALVCYPLMVENEFFGFIGFDETRNPRKWSRSENRLLETASGIIANAFRENIANKALALSEKKFRSLTEAIADPYVVFDQQLKYIYWNDSYEKENGLKSGDLKGKTYREVFSDKADEAFEKNLKAALKNTSNIKMFAQINGKHFEHLIYGGQDQVSVISNDITEQVKLEQSLEKSKKEYQLLYHKTPAMMHSIDKQGKIISVSDFWLEKMGYTEDEVLGKKSTDFLTEKSKKYANEVVLPEFIKTGHCKDIPYDFVKKSGEIMNGSLSAISELDDKGNFIRSLAVIRDVTVERKAEIEIRQLNASLEEKVRDRTAKLHDISVELFEQKSILESVIQNSDSMIFIKDLEGRYLMVNKQFYKSFGIDEKLEVVGKTDFDFFPKEKAKFFREMDQKAIDMKKLIAFEEVVKEEDQPMVFLTSKFPLFDADGEIYATCGIATDISEQKRQQEQLEYQTEELQMTNEILSRQQVQLKKNQKQLMAANEELESFSYSVSHDLRAPLRALEGFSKLLITNYKDTLDERGQNWLNFINNNAIKMDELINDILSFSRISRSDITKREFDMDALVREVVKEEKKNYKKHKVDINISKLRPANGDQKALRQVWVNLISNAFKYSSKKDKIKIDIDSKDLGESIQYTITDEGAGFDQEFTDKLFSVFQRLHKEEDFAGTGVGLAIAKKIIDKHHGKISATSKLGKGTTFNFTLPKDYGCE